MSKNRTNFFEFSAHGLLIRLWCFSIWWCRTINVVGGLLRFGQCTFIEWIATKFATFCIRWALPAFWYRFCKNKQQNQFYWEEKKVWFLLVYFKCKHTVERFTNTQATQTYTVVFCSYFIVSSTINVWNKITHYTHSCGAHEIMIKCNLIYVLKISFSFRWMLNIDHFITFTMPIFQYNSIFYFSISMTNRL